VSRWRNDEFVALGSRRHGTDTGRIYDGHSGAALTHPPIRAPPYSNTAPVRFHFPGHTPCAPTISSSLRPFVPPALCPSVPLSLRPFFPPAFVPPCLRSHMNPGLRRADGCRSFQLWPPPAELATDDVNLASASTRYSAVSVFPTFPLCDFWPRVSSAPCRPISLRPASLCMSKDCGLRRE
jgi:hypothetical protein